MVVLLSTLYPHTVCRHVVLGMMVIRQTDARTASLARLGSFITPAQAVLSPSCHR